jgi:hypothetical protein
MISSSLKSTHPTYTLNEVEAEVVVRRGNVGEDFEWDMISSHAKTETSAQSNRESVKLNTNSHGERTNQLPLHKFTVFHSFFGAAQRYRSQTGRLNRPPNQE